VSDPPEATRVREIGAWVSSSPADPHRIGPFGGWHFGSMAGRTLRGAAPQLETPRARRKRSPSRAASSESGLDGQTVIARFVRFRARIVTRPATRSAARSVRFNPPRKTRIGRGGPARRRRREVCSLGSRAPRVARHRELTTGPANLSSGRAARVAGSTRVMKSGVQCSRIAAMTEANERHHLCKSGVGALASPLGNCEEVLAARAARCEPARARDLVRGKARGAPPGPGSERDLDRALLGEIDLFTGIGRACGNAFALTRGLHAHSAVVVGVGSPPRVNLMQMRSAQQGCSRIRREIPSGRTGRIALSSECSYRFVVCMLRRHGIALLS